VAVVIDFRLLLVSAGILACAATVAACGEGSSGGELRGTISLEGPGTLDSLSRAVAKDFERVNPGVDITVNRSGSAPALKSLCAGKIDIAGASRPVGAAEKEACKRNGISYADAAVANAAVVVLLNPDNPKTCLRVGHLEQIWRPKRPISRWSELADNAYAFGAPIKRFGPDPSSTPFEFFTGTINGTEGRQTRAYTQAGRRESRTVERVAKAEGGIGYVDFSAFPPASGAVRAAEIESEAGICVLPDLVSIQDGSYSPLSRELHIYPSAEALKNPAIKAFVDYYRKHASEVAASVGLVPLSEAQREE
jgi:phosphate transport system substrate-binding protein